MRADRGASISGVSVCTAQVNSHTPGRKQTGTAVSACQRKGHSDNRPRSPIKDVLTEMLQPEEQRGAAEEAARRRTALSLWQGQKQNTGAS